MCGITALILSQPKNKLINYLYHSILALQHRGYDGCGLAYVNQLKKKNLTSEIKLIKQTGMISECFNLFPQLENNDHLIYGIAHTRYKTFGELNHTQPLIDPLNTICLAHNGQIKANGHTPDSMYLLHLIIEQLTELGYDFTQLLPSEKRNSSVQTSQIIELLFYSITKIFNIVEGSYSVVMMVANLGLVIFRDPNGIRPLILGQTTENDYLISSENVSHMELTERLGVKWTQIRDVNPGECLIIPYSHVKLSPELISRQLVSPLVKFTPCIFEYIYLSSVHSTINQLPIITARQELGKLLAKRIKRDFLTNNPTLIDLVIPIPESSCIAAQELATELNLKYLHLLELNQNRKQARSFILPTQQERIEAVANKFIIPKNYDLRGQNILLVDDSIVRGTTLRHLISTIRSHCLNLGRILVGSVAPPIKHRNIYGIDIPDTALLVAYRRTPEQVAEHLGADQVIYQDLSEMLELFSRLNPLTTSYEHSMFIEDWEE